MLEILLEDHFNYRKIERAWKLENFKTRKLNTYLNSKCITKFMKRLSESLSLAIIQAKLKLDQ